MYRLGGILYSVRTGFGTLSGYGESVANLDERMMAPRPVGINYGYVEGELRFHRLVGLAARGLAGQSRAGAGGGAELKLRIGSELGTNLIIGGAIISDFGALAQLKLEWNVIRSWPMSVTVVATNQPVQTDLGVRLIYQVGWRFRGWFAPTARIGYDVRNINHGGLSVGPASSWAGEEGTMRRSNRSRRQPFVLGRGNFVQRAVLAGAAPWWSRRKTPHHRRRKPSCPQCPAARQPSAEASRPAAAATSAAGLGPGWGGALDLGAVAGSADRGDRSVSALPPLWEARFERVRFGLRDTATFSAP